MKKTAYLGFSLLLIWALAIPSFAQNNTPDGLYTAFYNEMDAAKKLALGEQFINNPDPAFKSSQYLPYIFQTVFGRYVQSQNVAKTVETADKLATLVPSADNKLKGFVFGQTMATAYQANNIPKTLEYGEKLLTLDPGNVNALMVLPPAILSTLPPEGPARNTALAKAEDYSKKLIATAAPAGVPPAQWQGVQAQAHAQVGQVNLMKGMYTEAATSLEAALKLNPKDDAGHYQLGLAYQNQLANAQKMVLDAYTAENAAKNSRADQLQIDELAARRSALEAEFRARRDMAIDSFARAVAIGGPNAANARTQLERLYKQKNNDSLDGLDALIAQKKSELGD
jgi:tetratricopeptide (TPR) repeat protein